MSLDLSFLNKVRTVSLGVSSAAGLVLFACLQDWKGFGLMSAFTVLALGGSVTFDYFTKPKA